MNSSDQLLLSEIKDLFSNFKCTLQDLRTPTEDFVTNYYSFWLQEFEVDINNVVQTQFSQMDIVGSYSDAYTGVIPKLNLLQSIRTFEIIPDFGILDIISPTPKRTVYIIRELNRFYGWSDFRIRNIVTKRDLLHDRKEKLSKMIKEREELKESLNNIARDLGTIQQVKEQLEEKIVDLQQRSSERRMEKQRLKTTLNEINQKLKETENTLQKIVKEDMMIINKKKENSNQIVESPKSIISELENMRLKKEEKSKLSDQKRDMVEEKMKAHNKLEKLLNNQERIISELDELSKLIDQHREKLQIVATFEKNTSEYQKELNELKSLLNMQSNKKENSKKVLESLSSKWKTLKTQLSESVEAAIREQKEKKDAQNNMIHGLKEDSAVQKNIDFYFENIRNHIEDFERDFNNLQMQINENVEASESNLRSHMDYIRKEAEKKK